MIALRPLTVGELLDSAIRTYRERFRTLVAAVAVPMVPVVVLQTLIAWSIEPDDADPLSAPNTSSDIQMDEALLQLGGSLVNLAVVLIGTSLATAACFRALSAAYVGREVTWQESLAFARSRVWSVLGLTLLTFLGTLGGLLLCIVGAFVFMTWWAVATPALLMEGLGPADAMGRSASLAKRRFWPVLGALLLSMLLATVFQVVIAAPFIGLLFTDIDGIVLHLVEAVVSLIGLVLVTPFTAAFVLALYVDLRVRFEGFDLYLLADGSGHERPDSPGTVHPGGPAGPGAPGPVAPGGRPPSFGPPTSSLPPPPSAGFGPPAPPPPRGTPPPDDRHG